MNKADLIAKIAEEAELSKKSAEAALNAFVGAVETALKKGEKVQLVGFGSFEVRKRAARKGRNPQTKEEIKIPASKAPVFRAGKALKDLVNRK
ncbi:MAG: HU family DNA-binding protein [Clostridia bacterium]|nr:HU family DNA-binding protein [Clostridia bacterium]